MMTSGISQIAGYIGVRSPHGEYVHGRIDEHCASYYSMKTDKPQIIYISYMNITIVHISFITENYTYRPTREPSSEMTVFVVIASAILDALKRALQT